MKSQRVVPALVLLIVLTLSAQRAGALVPLGPSAFDVDSARLSHPYLTISVGDVMAYSGYGGYRGDLRLESATAVESLDGVQCLVLSRDDYWSRWDEDKKIVEEFRSTKSYWLAQDVEGNVWLLGFEDQNGTPYYFGARTPVLKLPAELQVGDSWQYLYGYEFQVLTVSSSIDQLRNGLGPFSDCVHLRLARVDGTFEYLYYAPTLGLAYFSFEDASLGENWPGWVEGLERVPTEAPVPGPGSIQFNADIYQAVEGPYWFQVAVVRSGGNEGVVSVRREVTDSVAATKPGIYLGDARVVYLAPGQSALTFDVRLNNDDFWSHQRTMNIALTEPGGDATLGQLTTATVKVEDDESGEDPGVFIGPCFLNLLGAR